MYSIYKITDLETNKIFIGSLDELSQKLHLSKHQIIWCANQNLNIKINGLYKYKVKRIKRSECS